MKTLILNGSPRINGDTSRLIRKVTEKEIGEYKIVEVYRCNISPCLDCRHCWQDKGCSIYDEMQEVYQYIQECDNILIASPLYFSELTGRLLDVGSRLQTYFCARFFRNEEPIVKSKRGAVILVGGGDGHVDKAYDTACTLLHHMNCRSIHEVVYSHNTNTRPAINDENVLMGLNSICDFFRCSLFPTIPIKIRKISKRSRSIFWRKSNIETMHCLWWELIQRCGLVIYYPLIGKMFLFSSTIRG